MFAIFSVFREIHVATIPLRQTSRLIIVTARRGGGFRENRKRSKAEGTKQICIPRNSNIYGKNRVTSECVREKILKSKR